MRWGGYSGFGRLRWRGSVCDGSSGFSLYVRLGGYSGLGRLLWEATLSWEAIGRLLGDYWEATGKLTF